MVDESSAALVRAIALKTSGTLPRFSIATVCVVLV